ncbi:MAG TPA: Flp family type IVb pilin [Alteraurantiacibacter sp.]|jgi:pilus assembly protein Flp/PilA
MFRQLLADESGATAIEYALIAVLISIAFIIAATQIGLDLASTFSSIAGVLNTANAAG